MRTIGQLANTPGWSLEPLLGPAASEKLTALAWIAIRARSGRSAGRDPPAHSPRSAKSPRNSGSSSRPCAISPTGLPVGSAPIAPGRTVTVRVRFADLRSVTRSTTLDAPMAATVTLAEIAEELVHKALAHHPDEKIISLLAISVSQLEKLADLRSNCRFCPTTTGDGPAPEPAWHAGWPIAPSTPSAIVSAGRRSATARSRWGSPVRCLTRSANLPRRSYRTETVDRLRHCERSEAIQNLAQALDCFVAIAPGNGLD